MFDDLVPAPVRPVTAHHDHALTVRDVSDRTAPGGWRVADPVRGCLACQAD